MGSVDETQSLAQNMAKNMTKRYRRSIIISVIISDELQTAHHNEAHLWTFLY